MAAQKIHKAWYVIVAGILGAFLATVTVFKEFAWALPWSAATKEEVQTLDEKLDYIKGELGLVKDILIEQRCPNGRRHERNPSDRTHHER